MPIRKRKGEWEILYLELPKGKAIKERLALQASRNARSPTAEAMFILDGSLPTLEEEKKKKEQNSC
jgi:hypothetical protein